MACLQNGIVAHCAEDRKDEETKWIPGCMYLQIYYYHGFQANVDSAKLYNDLRWNVTRPQGLEAVMRVRCSNVCLYLST